MKMITAWWMNASGEVWALPCYMGEKDGVPAKWTDTYENGIDDVVVDDSRSLEEYARDIASGLGLYLGIGDDITCPDCGQRIRWGRIETHQCGNWIPGWCGCPSREWAQEDRGGEWVIVGYED